MHVDGLLAVGQRARAERLEGRLGRGDGGVGRRDRRRALPDGFGRAVRGRRAAAHLGEDLLDDAADQVFGHLHGWVTVVSRSLTDRVQSAYLGREDRLAADVDRVDQADHHRVDRQLLGLGREPGARPLADQDHLVEPRAQRVDHHERPPVGTSRSRAFSSTR